MKKKHPINPLQAALQTVSELTADDMHRIEKAILEHRLDILSFLQPDQKQTVSH